jgi:hypothetical protein
MVRRDIPGSKVDKDSVQRNKSYYSARSKADKTNIFPKFTHTRESENMTTYADEDYYYVILNYAYGTNAAYLADGLIEAVNTGHMTGNMKDLVAAQETGFDNLSTNIICVLFDLAWQKHVRYILDNPPEQNTNNLTVSDGGIANVKVPVYTPDEYNTTIGNMEGRGLVVPNVILEILKAFNWYVKRTEPYNVGSSTIPASYFSPFISYYTPDNLDALIQTCYTNIGQAKLYMDKFGVKYKTFSESDLEPIEKKLFPIDDDLIAYFNHMVPIIYDGANPQAITHYPFSADNSESHRYYFRNDPNDSKIHAYAKLLHAYNATYNKYGGLFYQGATQIPTTQNYVNALYCDKQESTGWKGNSIAGFSPVFSLSHPLYKQTNTLNVSYTGTYLSADIDLTQWPLAIQHDLKYGSGLNETKTDNIFLNQIIKDMF